MRILFVCSGNTCRSPMAQALLRKALSVEPSLGLLNGNRVESAGLQAFSGQAPSPEAVEVMRDHAIDLSTHRARRLTEQMMDESDLIITMTRSHCRQLQNDYPFRRQNIWLLSELAGFDEIDIEDPFGLGIKEYARTAILLKNMIDKMLKRTINNSLRGW